MNVERYSFAGGYASFNGKIGWGGEISYLAGLHYRGVDPRPRNITGDLSLSAGIGLAGPLGYFIALSGMFRKYKQTNEVTFFSELGNEKLYHLTGLGADYKRFAGTGYDTYYNGYAYGIVMSLFPSSAQGFSASVALSRFTFENIISDFNKLPMAEAGHNRLEAEIGYTQPRWGLKGTLLLSRRVGKENIFGDPASQVYPLIGSLPLFYENRADLAVAGFWEKSFSRQRITILPEIGYHHWNMIYADPSARQYVNDLSTALKAKCTTPLGRTFLSVSASGRWIKPIASRLDIGNFSDTSDVSTEIYTSDFRFLSKDNWYAGIEASLTIPVTAKYALQGSVSWTHGFHALDVSSDKLGTSLSFIF